MLARVSPARTVWVTNSTSRTSFWSASKAVLLNGSRASAARQRRRALVDPLGHALLDAALEPGLPVPRRLVVLVDEERDLPLIERAAELALALEPLRLRAGLGSQLLAGRERRRRRARRRGPGGGPTTGLTLRRGS